MSKALRDPQRQSNGRYQARLPHAYVVTAGFLLGIVSFIGDIVGGTVADVITAVVSTGSAWCLVSLIAGYLYSRPLSSVTGAVVTLLVATLTYYVATAASGVRVGGYIMSTSAAGSSLTPAGWQSGLTSMIRGVLFWAVVSLGTGLVMGSLGYSIHAAARKLQAIAAGAAIGIIAGPGVHSALIVVRYGLNETTETNILPAIFQLTLSGVGLVWVVFIRRCRIAWPWFVLAVLTVCVATTALWEAVDILRNQI